MTRRLDELDDEEAREIAAITDRYADVKPHTTAAAVVFALTRGRRRRVGRLMARRTTRAGATFSAPSVTELHRAWLELVDTEGPFLAIPPLKRVWPQGMPGAQRRPQDRTASTPATTSRQPGRSSTEHPTTTLPSTPTGSPATNGSRPSCAMSSAGPSRSSWGEVPGVQAQSPNRAVTVTAQAALNGADGIGALVHVIDPVDSLRQTPSDLWAATPIDRIEAHAAGEQASRSASSPTAAGGAWSAPATARWPPPGSSTR